MLPVLALLAAPSVVRTSGVGGGAAVWLPREATDAGVLPLNATAGGWDTGAVYKHTSYADMHNSVVPRQPVPPPPRRGHHLHVFKTSADYNEITQAFRLLAEGDRAGLCERGPGSTQRNVQHHQQDGTTSKNQSLAVVVVGAGPHGLMRAIEDATQGHKVIVLEAREMARANERTNRLIVGGEYADSVHHDMHQILSEGYNIKALMPKELAYINGTFDAHFLTIGIENLQALLYKCALLNGVEVRFRAKYEDAMYYKHQPEKGGLLPRVPPDAEETAKPLRVWYESPAGSGSIDCNVLVIASGARSGMKLKFEGEGGGKGFARHFGWGNGQLYKAVDMRYDPEDAQRNDTRNASLVAIIGNIPKSKMEASHPLFYRSNDKKLEKGFYAKWANPGFDVLSAKANDTLLIGGAKGLFLFSGPEQYYFLLTVEQLPGVVLPLRTKELDASLGSSVLKRDLQDRFQALIQELPKQLEDVPHKLLDTGLAEERGGNNVSGEEARWVADSLAMFPRDMDVWAFDYSESHVARRDFALLGRCQDAAVALVGDVFKSPFWPKGEGMRNGYDASIGKRGGATTISHRIQNFAAAQAAHLSCP